MAKNPSGWKIKLLLSAVSTGMVIASLGLGELYCRIFTRINFLDNSRGMFVYKKFGNSYGLKPKFVGISFGETFVTDDEGFRIDPVFKSSASSDTDALLLMGDSVAFGPALTDDVTIAGNLRMAMPTVKIYNGSAIGYDSFDYKTVTLARLEQHPEIKTVVLFICLNDISDASSQLIRSQTGQSSEDENAIPSPSIPRRVNDYLRSRSKLFLWLKNALIDTQLNYFKFDLAGYQKGEQNVADALKPVVELDKELKERGISLKIFVSPYEAQLRQHPPEGADLPQRLIAAYLTQNGVEKYDLVSVLKQASADPKELFLYGDPMHLSAEGSKIAASAVCAKLENCQLQ